MADQENISDDLNLEDADGHHHHHHHRHKHKYRTRERVRIKSNTPKIKKKAKKYLTYVLWTLLIALFVVSIIFLIKELNNLGIIKDRRNVDNIFMHLQNLTPEILKA